MNIAEVWKLFSPIGLPLWLLAMWYLLAFERRLFDRLDDSKSIAVVVVLGAPIIATWHALRRWHMWSLDT